MALALYRKYRPRTFAEVIGQDHVTEPLSQALRSGRLHHAYLFSGPRGCGKTSSARILARSLNCERGPTPEPCGVCESCKSLAGDGTGSLDVIEIDAASHGGVDDARELRERAFFAPASSRFKIYVIDEAHMVSTQGFNALLKLVEEPPDYVKFIFATTEPDKVLGTIKSRTHHYPFRLIPPGVLRPYLEQLASAEGVKVEPAVFPLVVRAGGGSARDSLSVLDQLIAGAGPDGVSYAGAVALLGVTDAALIDEMCDAIAAGDGAAAFGTIDRVAEAGHDSRRFASDLLERLRDLIVLQQVPDAATKGLIDGPSDQLERMASQAQRLGPVTLSRGADIVHNGLIEMRGTTAPRLLLELIVARMLLPAADEGEGALLQRMERMERRLTIQADEGVRRRRRHRRRATGRAAPAAPTTATARAARPNAAPRSGRRRWPGSGRRPARTAPARPAPRHAPRRQQHGTRRAVRSHGTRRAGLRHGTLTHPTPRQVPRSPAPRRVLRSPRRAGCRAVQRRGTHAQGISTAPAAQRTATAPAAQPSAAEPAHRVRTAAAGAVRGHGRPGHSRAGIPSSAPPSEIDAAAVRRVWDEILAMVGQKSKKVAAWAREATVRDIDGKTLVLTFRHSFHARALSEQPDLISKRPTRCSASVGRSAARWPATSDRSRRPRHRPGRPRPPPNRRPSPRGPTGRPRRRRKPPLPAAPMTGRSPPRWAATPEPPQAKPAAPPAPPAEAAGDPRTAARAAASGRGRPAAPAADAEWAGEPPYDPEYDGPAQAAAPPEVAAQSVPYEGFDPGDVPTDEVIDEKTARQTSEQQAVQLLQQALGAERIGEVELK